ncbi:MAG: hypothetical protein ACRD9R_23910 [Pyrinomonadaceae bacterium]
MGLRKTIRLHACGLFFVLGLSVGGAAQESSTPNSAGEELRREDVSVITRDLTHRDPLVRQRAAEELARLAAVDQRRLLEGYRLQEKDARARLALDWALYRTGKERALYEIVRALDTKTLYLQAQSYLGELEGPQPLYKFLAPSNGNTQMRLLESLARCGDTGTLEVIEPYAASLDPKIADAARFAAREINLRLAAENNPEAVTRQRKMGGQTP